MYNKDPKIQTLAIKALPAHEKLPVKVLASLEAQLGCQDQWTRYAAIEALAAREELPAEVVAHIASRLDDQCVPIRQAALEVLISNPTLPAGVISGHLRGLYMALLKKSWCEDVSWTTANHESLLQVDQSSSVVLSGWTELLTKEVSAIRSSLGVPL
jgi:hypothetical protein